MDPDKAMASLSEEIRRYAESTEARVAARIERAGDEVIEKIRATAPRSGGGGVHLADSFVKDSSGDGSKRTVTVYSKEKGRLVHLVEFGFVHRSGKLVAARPFMRPAYEEAAPRMLEEIRSIIKEGG